MAQKLLNIIAMDSVRHDLSIRSLQIAGKMFDFGLYSKQIELLGLDAARKISGESQVSQSRVKLNS
jgi:hypothetical protein